MIHISDILPVLEVLKGCRISIEGNVIMIVDVNGEMVGDIAPELSRFALYADYDYYQAIEKKLKANGITLDSSGLLRREAENMIDEAERKEAHEAKMRSTNQSN